MWKNVHLTGVKIPIGGVRYGVKGVATEVHRGYTPYPVKLKAHIFLPNCS
nr:MAG TPA: hypothetical protein [Caudoviricetes sp.]